MLRFFKISILLSSICILLFQCNSLPEPSIDNKTILVIPLIRSGDPNAKLNSNYTISIISFETNGILKTTHTTQKNGYKIVTGLKPGKYIISAQLENTNSRHESSIKKTNQAIELFEGYITIPPIALDMIVMRISASRSSIGHHWIELSDDARNNILIEIQKEDNFPLWKIKK